MMWPRFQLDHRKLRKVPTTQRDDEEDDLAMPVVVDVLEGLPDLLCAKEQKGLSGSRRAVSSHLSPFYMAHRAEMLDRIASRRQVRYEENKEEENARNRIRYLSHRDDMLEYQRQ